MEIRPGYKKTEAGVIPADWCVKTVEEVAAVGRGRVISHREISRSFSPSYPVYSSQTKNNGVMGYLDTFEFEGEYVTWTTDGANAGTVFSRSGRFNCTNVCGTIKLKSDNHELFAKILGRIAPRHVSRHLGNPKLMNDVVKRIEVPLPPTKGEQDAIATALRDMDALLAGLDRLIAKKRDLKQAAMQQLLTGQTRLPGFQGAWESRPLSAVVSDLEAGVSVNSVAGASYSCSGERGILKTSCVSDGIFEPTEYKLIDPRDLGRARLSPRRNSLIVSRMNTPNLVGEVGFVERDYPELFLPDRLWMTRFVPNSGLCPKWLAYVLSSPGVQSAIKGLASGTSGSMKNIAKRKLLALPLSFPESQEQRAIATVLSEMDAELASLEARRDKTRALKQGMMQELLTGRTRLV